MAAIERGEFRCVVIVPQGTLLNCATTSVVFPAHDGYVGIWPNHMPMFCKLGLGIMEIKQADGENSRNGRAHLFIDGGFALLSSNLLTITAYEAISLEGAGAEKVRQTVEKFRRRLATGAYTPHQRWCEEKKLSLLLRLAHLYGYAEEQGATAK
jgi:F0F1-type ATP synthase epsilon subunit